MEVKFFNRRYAFIYAGVFNRKLIFLINAFIYFLTKVNLKLAVQSFWLMAPKL